MRRRGGHATGGAGSAGCGRSAAWGGRGAGGRPDRGGDAGGQESAQEQPASWTSTILPMPTDPSLTWPCPLTQRSPGLAHYLAITRQTHTPTGHMQTCASTHT